MQYHELVLETIYRTLPSTRNTISITNAILNGYTVKDIVSNPLNFNITLSGQSLKSSISRIKAHL
ncbi:MAG: hypothetical protein GY787_16525 [Alteromonadales bacterium]|nr:hypothetical protein [Alteromonadales bacterium]